VFGERQSVAPRHLVVAGLLARCIVWLLGRERAARLIVFSLALVVSLVALLLSSLWPLCLFVFFL